MFSSISSRHALISIVLLFRWAHSCVNFEAFCLASADSAKGSVHMVLTLCYYTWMLSRQILEYLEPPWNMWTPCKCCSYSMPRSSNTNNVISYHQEQNDWYTTTLTGIVDMKDWQNCYVTEPLCNSPPSKMSTLSWILIAGSLSFTSPSLQQWHPLLVLNTFPAPLSAVNVATFFLQLCRRAAVADCTLSWAKPKR